MVALGAQRVAGLVAVRTLVRGMVVPWMCDRRVSEVYGVMEYHGVFARRVYIASIRTKDVS
jgi:hypothetical protein